MNEERREVIIVIARAANVVNARIKEAFMNLAEQINDEILTIDELCTVHEESQINDKTLRQSWFVKQDTRRLSQVITNKPFHIPRILY
ncbi:hypothetical protein [Priestia aryabhattai]|uniref:hypothetical protein n=1 Tax=Priestia aryabhattai TaxID=412384 RepID=UPI0023AECB7D|nr:hypothetical protein [Priestia aryabhattai]MDE8676466.1 hypothetical protein [Priestia aryabhattai]